MKIPLLNLKNQPKEEINNHTLISSLAPKVLIKSEDIEKIQPYLDKLNQTIDTKGINNIALTGGYGSGKSTIIGTFKRLNSHYDFLNISLASFNKKETKDILTPAEKKQEKEELQRLLEVSILQQIFYHVKPDEIPESRFKRIVNIPDWKIMTISIGFILWVSSSVLLLKYDYLDKINPNNWNVKYDFDWFTLLVFVIVFIGLGSFSKLIIKLFSNSKINKVNIKGELELGDNVNKSVFNEHLEEILYFFERTKYNVVIIEDLDRFDSTDIFTKLREINILLNNSKLISREINFVYAVGDDLFDDKKERVKFFEYIIPVIPFINSSNADEQLRTLIKEAGLDKNIFTREFISDTTTFIDDIDMRLLTNIFHEFVIYRKILKPDLINKNDELFAIITYKNIDPKDFNLLNKREGKLYELINNKSKYSKELIKKMESQIAFKYSQITNIDSHFLDDLNDLKNIYFYKILSKLPHNALIDKTILDLDFDELIEKEKLVYKYLPTGYYQLHDNKFSFKFSEIEDEVNSTNTYEDRVKLISSKFNHRVDSLKNEVEELKQKKSEIEHWDLKQIFSEIEVNQYLDKFSNNKLLRILISEGYINENYNDYISLFHEVSIKKEDKIFEQSIKSRINSDFNYQLTNIENLLDKHLEFKYFERDAILNFDLLDYLGNNYNKYPNNYDAIIRLLSNEKERSIQFIDQYIKNEDRPIEIFIEKLVSNWKGFWEYIVEKSVYDRVKIDEYLRVILTYSKIETILSCQNKRFLDEIISTNPKFLSLVKNGKELDYFKKISQLLKELNIKFEKLDNPTEDTEKLFDFIYNNNLYKINKENVLQMLLIFNKKKLEEDFKLSNYSIVIKSECKPLINYINSDINAYVENVYLKLEENIIEEENSLIHLLNNVNLNNKLKVKIIQKVTTKISHILDIEELDTIDQLLLHNKLTPTWNNTINYFDKFKEFNDILVGFLNNEDVYSELSVTKNSSDRKDFEEALVKCKKLSDGTYDKLLDGTKYHWTIIDFEDLNLSKVRSLLAKRLSVTKENYHSLKENFPNIHIELLEKNFTKFIQNRGGFEVNDSDILSILSSDKINVDNKWNYISLLQPLTITDNNMFRIIGEIILKKNLPIEFEYSNIDSLIKNAHLTEEKLRLVTLYIQYLDNNQLIKVISLIGWNYGEMFRKQHRPTLIINNDNTILLNLLKTKELIKRYEVDKKDKSLYRIIANY